VSTEPGAAQFPGISTKSAGVPWLKTIPAHWTWARMKDVCSKIIDCKNRTPPEVDDGKFFVVRTSCIRSGRFNIDGGYQTDEASFNEWTKRGRAQPNDVLFTREAPMGEACLAPEDLDFCLGQRMMIYRPDPRKIEARFIVRTIYSAIGKSYVEAKGKGSTVGHLRVPEVYDFPCLLAPLDEQRTILAELDKQVGAYDALRVATRKSIEVLRELRSALITSAVTGQIDVTSWSKRGATDRSLDALQESCA
jgi:type I restriction enzyme S subunit